jgi:hypothetical protein
MSGRSGELGVRENRGGRTRLVFLLRFLSVLSVSLWVNLLGGAAHAQSQADLERMARELKSRHPKLVEVCFDVSGSMENLHKFSPLREALIPLLKEGLKPGDRCVVTAFDADVQEQPRYDRTLRDEADIDDAINALPGDVTPNRVGTDIRRTHHLALQRGASGRLPATYIILVSDSFNDTPSAADPAKANYKNYYVLDEKGIGQLKPYPRSSENQEYERLLRNRHRLNLTTWGIGIDIDPVTGRPIERMPTTPEMKEEPPVPASTPAEEKKKGEFPWIPILLGVLALAAIAAWMIMNQPVRVSLSEGAKRHQNYSLRPREAIVLGGSTAKGDERGYPIPGPLQPCAYLERGMRDFRLRPGEAAAAGDAALFLNNEEVRGPSRIDYSDDIKIRVGRPNAAAAPPAEYRLQFGRAINEHEA